MEEFFQQNISKQVWFDTYKWETDETPIESYYRTAIEIANSEEEEEKFKELLINQRYVPGGRVISNAGTGLKNSYMNCFVSGFRGKNQDSIESIYEELTRQANILKSEGGYGFCIDVLRPRGAYIKGIGTSSPGPVEILDLWDTSSAVITKGSGLKSVKGKNKPRKGAMMVTLSCWHPSIEEYITSKRQSNKLTKFNISVLVTDKFMEAVKNNKPWKLEFPDIDHPDYDELWDGYIENWRSKGLPIITYKEYENANELWDIIMSSTYKYNDPGVLFVDRINQLNNLYYCEIINATNPCFPDTVTVIEKTRGRITIKELNVGDFIYSEDGWVKVVAKFSNGIKQVNRYHTEKNNMDYIDLTPNHKVVANGVKTEVKNSDIIDCLGVTEENIVLTFSDKITDIEDLGEMEVWDITVDGEHHTFFCNNYNISNCGEQMLPVGGSCNLGNVNLTKYINKTKTDFDYKLIAEDLKWILRFQDNVIDKTMLPLEEQKSKALNTRPLGIGYMGYGSALYMMKIPYGSEKAIKMTDKLAKFITNGLYVESSYLAKERGSFPDYNAEKFLKSNFIKQALTKETVELIKENGIRNCRLTTVAPTGNTGIFTNNVSGGLEPVISPKYTRTITLQFYPEEVIKPTHIDWVNKTVDCDGMKWSFITEGKDIMLKTVINGKTYKIDQSRGLTTEEDVMDYSLFNDPTIEEDMKNGEEYIKTIFNLTPEAHIETMKTFARYIDAGISKTINLPAGYPYEDFKNIYMDAYDTGYIKGFTTYIQGTMSSVLSVKEETIEEDNERVAPSRPKEVEGEIHHVTVNGSKWIVFVGLIEKKIYEVFCGKIGEINIPTSISKCVIVKEKRGKYKIKIGDDIIIEDISKFFENDTYEGFTRLVSTSLRHDVPLNFIIEQLNKAKGSMVNFEKSIARVLKKYILDGTKSTDICECGTKFTFVEGCLTCMNCGSSKCS